MTEEGDPFAEREAIDEDDNEGENEAAQGDLGSPGGGCGAEQQEGHPQQLSGHRADAAFRGALETLDQANEKRPDLESFSLEKYIQRVRRDPSGPAAATPVLTPQVPQRGGPAASSQGAAAAANASLGAPSGRNRGLGGGGQNQPGGPRQRLLASSAGSLGQQQEPQQPPAGLGVPHTLSRATIPSVDMMQMALLAAARPRSAASAS